MVAFRWLTAPNSRRLIPSAKALTGHTSMTVRWEQVEALRCQRPVEAACNCRIEWNLRDDPHRAAGAMTNGPAGGFIGAARSDGDCAHVLFWNF